MKKNCLIALAVFFLCFADTQGQKLSPAEEKKALTDKSLALFQQGKLDDAIEVSAKVVALEKKSLQSDSTSLVNATLNLARFRRDNFMYFREKMRNRNTLEDSIRFRGKADENAAGAEELYREALKLNESGGRGVSAQTADIKSDLAWLVHNYLPVNDSILTDRPATRSRIDEAEAFYAASLALNEQTRGKDADETLFVALASGNFYLTYDNYEKALPFYERYILTADKKHGSNHAEVANALRPHAQILHALFQEQEAVDAVKRIEGIIGKNENLTMGKLGLDLRSKDSVAFHSGVSRSLKDKNKAFGKKMTLAGGSMSRPAFDASKPRVTYTPVYVTVDENGKVIEAAANTKDAELRERAEQEVSKWTVRPFVYNGSARKLRGILTYPESL